jgi:hypothetical protein
MAIAASATGLCDYVIKLAGMTYETHTCEQMEGRLENAFPALAALVGYMDEVKEAAAKCMELRLERHHCNHINRAAAAVAAEAKGWGEGQSMWEGIAWPLKLPDVYVNLVD